MSETQNAIVERITEKYLAGLPASQKPDTASIEKDLLNSVNREIAALNESPNRHSQFEYLRVLTNAQIAQVLLTAHHVVQAVPAYIVLDASTPGDLLGLYGAENNDEGIYITSKSGFRSLARMYNFDLTIADYESVHDQLKALAPHLPMWRESATTPRTTPPLEQATS